MRNEIIKVVKMFNVESAWGNNSNSSTIAFKIETEGKEKVGRISFEKVAGSNLDVIDLINVITLDIDILKNIKNYLRGVRVNNFYIEEQKGYSGRRTLTLYANAKFVGKRSDKKCSLNISCFDKVDVNEIQDMWIGDLIELLLVADPEYFKLCLTNVMCSKREIRNIRKEFFNYIKPLQSKKAVTMKDVLNWYEAKPINEKNENLKSLFEVQVIGDGEMLLNPNSKLYVENDSFNFDNIRVLSTTKEIVVKITNKFVLCFNIVDASYRKTSWKSIKNDIKNEYDVDFHIVDNCKLEAHVKINDKLYYSLSSWLRNKEEMNINRCLFHSIEEDGSLYVHCTERLKIFNDYNFGPDVYGNLDSYLSPISMILK